MIGSPKYTAQNNLRISGAEPHDRRAGLLSPGGDFDGILFCSYDPVDCGQYEAALGHFQDSRVISSKAYGKLDRRTSAAPAYPTKVENGG